MPSFFVFLDRTAPFDAGKQTILIAENRASYCVGLCSLSTMDGSVSFESGPRSVPTRR